MTKALPQLLLMRYARYCDEPLQTSISFGSWNDGGVGIRRPIFQTVKAGAKFRLSDMPMATNVSPQERSAFKGPLILISSCGSPVSFSCIPQGGSEIQYPCPSLTIHSSAPTISSGFLFSSWTSASLHNICPPSPLSYLRTDFFLLSNISFPISNPVTNLQRHQLISFDV